MVLLIFINYNKRSVQKNVICGLCYIETTLNEKGEIVQTSPFHRLVVGAFGEQSSERMQNIKKVFQGANFQFNISDSIKDVMWNKYLFISAFSGITTLMRSPIGPIRESEDGNELIRNVFHEITMIMSANGVLITEEMLESHLHTIETAPYEFKSSMLRDMEKNMPVEADHLQGYLLTLAGKYNLQTPLMKVIYQNLKIYERVREKNILKR
jgi:2-dehydropantoate 2-reductase